MVDAEALSDHRRMDAIVEAALKKWPNVPHCHGWLALDARGDWYLRDDRAQAAGSFPRVKGSRVEHAKLREFIERNYGCDAAGEAAGSWFFQNGPQRVYVTLEAAPWVWRLHADEAGLPVVVSHTGLPARAQSTWLDERGRLFIATELGFGLVHTLDMELASVAVERGPWVPQEMRFDAMPARFAYCLQPLPIGAERA